MINSQLRRAAPLDVKSALAPEIPRAGAVSNCAYRRIKGVFGMVPTPKKLMEFLELLIPSSRNSWS
jgi:hypothetical protein